MYLLVTARKGISSMQLAKEIGITQKSLGLSCIAFAKLAAKIWRSCKASSKLTKPILAGLKKTNMLPKGVTLGAARLARPRSWGCVNVAGARSPSLSIAPTKLQSKLLSLGKSRPVPQLTRMKLAHMKGFCSPWFNHETVDHKAGEYVRDDVTTNSVESVFAVLKRGLHGVYHHASPKHLGRYVDRFHVPSERGQREVHHTLTRLDSLIVALLVETHLQGANPMSEPSTTPKELDAIVDKVLAYKAKPKTKPAKKRKKRAAKIVKEKMVSS